MKHRRRYKWVSRGLALAVALGLATTLHSGGDWILVYSPEFKSISLTLAKSPQPVTRQIGVEAFSSSHGSSKPIFVGDSPTNVRCGKRDSDESFHALTCRPPVGPPALAQGRPGIRFCPSQRRVPIDRVLAGIPDWFACYNVRPN